jgi:hypothetical protein
MTRMQRAYRATYMHPYIKRTVQIVQQCNRTVTQNELFTKRKNNSM